MKLRDLIPSKKIDWDIHGTFKSWTTQEGKRVMTFLSDGGDRYVIMASLKNFRRFKDWDNHKAFCDIQKKGIVKMIDGKIYPLVHIATEVSIRKDNSEDDSY